MNQQDGRLKLQSRWGGEESTGGAVLGAASYVAACDDNIGAHPVEQANAVSRADNVKHAPAKNNKRERERERERGGGGGGGGRERACVCVSE